MYKVKTKIIAIILISLRTFQAIQQISDLCVRESDIGDLENYFGKENLEDILNNDTFVGKGSFGKVYKVPFRNRKNKKYFNIAIKELNVKDKKGNKKREEKNLEQITKEIAIVKEFSEIDEDQFVKFVNCFYLEDREQNITKVYLMQELLKDNLHDELETFRYLDKKTRYFHYTKLLNDLLFFHNKTDPPKKRIYLDGYKGYIHMDIKPDNIMSDTKISSGDFILKHIDFGLMFEYGTEKRHTGTPGYMHPSLVSDEFVPISPKMDIYSLFITIAQMEYGYESTQINKNSEKDCLNIEFGMSCLNITLETIYKAHCQKYGYEFVNDEFREILREAYSMDDCVTLICLIFRELRLDVVDIDNTQDAVSSMTNLYYAEKEKDRQRQENPKNAKKGKKGKNKII